MPLIPRQSPTLVLDVVVVGADRRSYTDRQSGEVRDQGRQLTVQTAGGQLLVNVPVEADEVVFEPGAHVLLNVELRQGRLDNGAEWENFTYASHVDTSQLASFRDVVGRQTKQEPVAAQ